MSFQHQLHKESSVYSLLCLASCPLQDNGSALRFVIGAQVRVGPVEGLVSVKQAAQILVELSTVPALCCSRGVG